MNYKVYITDEANSDFDEISDYIAEDNPERSIKFIGELKDKTFCILSDFPEVGVKYGNYRYLSFGNYTVVYRFEKKNNTSYIVLVSESHRLWKKILDNRC